LATGLPRMTETQHNSYWCYEGNLGTPLGYIDSATEFSAVVRALRMACLPHGTNLGTVNDDMTRFLFPFTPIELHAGYLLGKERIISIHSGNYGWPGTRCLVQVRHFDKGGKLTPADSATTVSREARTRVEVGEGEAIVLVRLPVTLQPRSGEARASGVSYGPEGLELTLTAPGGATLELSNGAFAVAAGGEYTAEIGSAVRTVTAGADRKVRVEVKTATPTRVRLLPASATD
jgi:hypothetical protein